MIQREISFEKSNTEKDGLTSKKDLRSHYKKVLHEIDAIRRVEAEENLLCYLKPRIEKFSHVVSFMSLPHEIDLTRVNQFLIQEKKLLLPKLEGDELEIYQVLDLEKDVEKGKKSILEPIASACKKRNSFDCILVPALAFDESRNRLGYGLGCYDKLLAKNSFVYSIGVGFREQYSHDLLPKEPHDQTLSELCLI